MARAPTVHHIGEARPMIYEIHRYPVDMIDVVRLAGGDRVVIRPVLPQDEELTAAFFHGLSALARHNRPQATCDPLPGPLISWSWTGGRLVRCRMTRPSTSALPPTIAMAARRTHRSSRPS